MKFRTLLIFTIFSSFIAFNTAWASRTTFTWFTSIPQAEEYCPSTHSLIYTASNQSMGTIKGQHNNTTFKSTSIVPKPGFMIGGGYIEQVQFRNAGSGYGYLVPLNNSVSVITCLYSYPKPAQTGRPIQQYHLSMRGLSIQHN